MGLWGRYDGMSFVGDALGSGRGWGSDRLLGPLRSATFRPRRVGEGVVGRVRCRHVDVRVAARALGADAPARISVLRRRHGLSHSRKASSGPGPHVIRLPLTVRLTNTIKLPFAQIIIITFGSLPRTRFSTVGSRISRRAPWLRCAVFVYSAAAYYSGPPRYSARRIRLRPHCTYIIHDEIKQNYMLFGYA